METNSQHFLKQWFLSFVSGIVFILLGAYILAGQVDAYVPSFLFFAVGFIIVGGIRVVYTLRNKDKISQWGWIFISGLADICVILLLLASPETTESVFPVYAGFLLLFRSIIGVGVALNFKVKHLNTWIPILIFSILGLIFSFLMIWKPVASGSSILLYAALTFLATGISQTGISLGIKRLNKELKVQA